MSDSKAMEAALAKLLETVGELSLGTVLPDYHSQEYWDERYKQQIDSKFDWYCDWKHLRPLLESSACISPSSTILHVGCGNSVLPIQAYSDGFKSVFNVDYSPVVVKSMREKHPEMDWAVMDASNLAVRSDTYDIVIDKGLLDAISCSYEKQSLSAVDSKVAFSEWKENRSRTEECIKVVQEMVRVTKPKGAVIIISHSSAGMRTEWYEAVSSQTEPVEETTSDCLTSSFYVHTLRKK